MRGIPSPANAARRAAQQARKAQKKLAEATSEAPGSLLDELRQDAEGTRKAGTDLEGEKVAREDWKDPNYLAVLVFESRAQKLAVLGALGMDVTRDVYISGTDVICALKAKMPGFQVPVISRPPHRLKENKVWAEMAEPLEKK